MENKLYDYYLLIDYNTIDNYLYYIDEEELIFDTSYIDINVLNDILYNNKHFCFIKSYSVVLLKSSHTILKVKLKKYNNFKVDNKYANNFQKIDRTNIWIKPI